MAQLVTLRNNTENFLHVIHNGQRESLPPFSEEIFREDVAKAFFAEHKGRVEYMDLDNLSAPVVDPNIPKTVWVANVTGNPDAPDTVADKRFNQLRKDYEEYQVTNKHKKPKPVEMNMKGDEFVETLQDGSTRSVRTSDKNILIPEYRVIELPANQAGWLLNRARQDSKGGYTFAIRSRPMPEWRPNRNWSLDDMRLYYGLAKDVKWDDYERYGRSEAQYKAQFSSNPDEVELTINRQKLLYLKRIFFVLADPTNVLPIKEEFETAKKLKLSDKKAVKEIKAVEEAFAG